MGVGDEVAEVEERRMCLRDGVVRMCDAPRLPAEEGVATVEDLRIPLKMCERRRTERWGRTSTKWLASPGSSLLK
jgi:hypothetical protein